MSRELIEGTQDRLYIVTGISGHYNVAKVTTVPVDGQFTRKYNAVRAIRTGEIENLIADLEASN